MAKTKEHGKLERALVNMLGDNYDITDLMDDWPYEYIPVELTPLQLGFCVLPIEQILFGGAAGGGKSEALLAAALRFIKRERYAGIIYRRTYADLANPGALLHRAKMWLQPHIENKSVKYDPQNKSFIFKEYGSVLAFGYMGMGNSAAGIQGSEYQFVGIDEVTQHIESDFQWAMSRLRPLKAVNAPTRGRFTANPGGIGHGWVKQYFKIRKNEQYDPDDRITVGGYDFSRKPPFRGKHEERRFIPARLIDNPHIRHEDYIKTLKELDPLTRDRLLNGDWDVSPNSRFKESWFGRYQKNGDYLTTPQGNFLIHQGLKFSTVDVAASTREGVGGEQMYSLQGATEQTLPCWSVISTWLLTDRLLFLLDVQRLQVEVPELFQAMHQTYNRWRVSELVVEANGVGRPVAQVAASQGLPIREVWTLHDKIQNSYTACNMAERGQIFLPDQSLNYPWLEDFENELFTWIGATKETSDQVDTVSTAAKYAQEKYPGVFSGRTEMSTRIPKSMHAFGQPRLGSTYGF